jgi:hypothetical protein
VARAANTQKSQVARNNEFDMTRLVVSNVPRIPGSPMQMRLPAPKRPQRIRNEL